MTTGAAAIGRPEADEVRVLAMGQLGNGLEAVTTIRETEVIARRVLGGAHPLTKRMGQNLRDARRAPRPRNAAGAGELVS